MEAERIEMVQIPSELTKVTSMANKSLRIIFDSQENLKDEEMARIMSCLGKIGWMCFLPEERKIDVLDVVTLPKLTYEKEEKSQSQRIRAVLHLIWKKTKPTTTSEEFYRIQTEKYINYLKEKLN